MIGDVMGHALVNSAFVLGLDCFSMLIFLIPVVSLVLWIENVDCHTQNLVVLDVDPGIDDAMAILTTLGDPSVTVEAITCVRGNVDVQTVVVNLYKILAVACRLEIPVYCGNNYGLVASPSSDNYFGKDGFGDLGDELKYDPKWNGSFKEEHAAAYLARIVKEKPGQVAILAIGPLTNVALALELNPMFIKQARKVVIMGGSIKGSGNVAPGIEYNFYADPDAAAVVLDRAESSKTAVTLVPMETVVDTDLGVDWRVKELSKIKSSAMSFLDKLEGRQRKMHPSEDKYYTPYDTYAAVALVNPRSIRSSERVYGYVETRGLNTRGVLLLDHHDLLKKHPNLEVITDMDKTQIQKTMMRNLSTYINCTGPPGSRRISKRPKIKLRAEQPKMVTKGGFPMTPLPPPK